MTEMDVSSFLPFPLPFVCPLRSPAFRQQSIIRSSDPDGPCAYAMQSYLNSVSSYIQSILRSLLHSLGLWNKTGTILLLGLDNAGKTSLFHRLRSNLLVTHFAPTDRPHVETFRFQGVEFTCWDLGGHEAVRHIWEDYAASDNISAILFLIDAADSIRLVEEVRDELENLVYEGIVRNVPVAILLNKCDLGDEHVMTNQQVATAIGFDQLRQRHGEDKMQIFRISVLRGEGYPEAIRWISSFL